MVDFKVLFEASPAAYLVLAPTPQFTILAVSDAYLRVSARDRASLVGQALFDAFPDLSGDPATSGAFHLRASLLRTLATRAPDVMPVQRYDIQVAGLTGSTIQERHWSPTNTPVLAPSGEVQYVIHHVHDVTQQVALQRVNEGDPTEIAALHEALAGQQRLQGQAELARLQAEELASRLQFTLDAAEIGDWDLDLADDRSYRSLRHDRCFGYEAPVEDWGFERFIMHVHADDRAFVRQQFEDSLAQLKDWHFECRVVWPDASIHWIAAHGTIYHSHGAARKMSGLVLDITARKSMEAELVQANSRKDEFLAMLAHELRNPLAPISAAADLLRMRHHEDEQLKKAASVIGRQVRHMTGLVDELLDVSRVTRGKVTLDRVTVDIKSVLAAAIEQTRPLVEARGHTFDSHLPPDNALVHGDPKRLVQVFANLLTNAAKFTDGSGRISTVLTVLPEELVVCVSDTGVGMDEALIATYFELFVQGERTADRSQGGLGIGLALAKRLVAMHGGSVSAWSEGAGKGSTFEVRLPRLTTLRHQDDVQSSELPVSTQPVRKLRILIVDDNQDAADLLQMVCDTLGHEAEAVYRPSDALQRSDEVTYDVYLLDVGLPEMDGHELAERLRARAAAAKFVAVTGYGAAQDKRAASAGPFHHHLVKPVPTSAIAALLEQTAASAPP